MTEGTDGGMPSNQGRGEISEVERVAALAKLFDADAPGDFDEVVRTDVSGPTSRRVRLNESGACCGPGSNTLWRGSPISTTTSFLDVGFATTATSRPSPRCATKSWRITPTPPWVQQPWSSTGLFATSKHVCASGPASWHAELLTRPPLIGFHNWIPSSGANS